MELVNLCILFYHLVLNYPVLFYPISEAKFEGGQADLPARRFQNCLHCLHYSLAFRICSSLRNSALNYSACSNTAPRYMIVHYSYGPGRAAKNLAHPKLVHHSEERFNIPIHNCFKVEIASVTKVSDLFLRKPGGFQ